MNKIIHPIEPEELMAYLDGELTADQATATAAHLGECTGCQGVVADLRIVSQNLKTWKVELPKSATPPAIATALTENRPAPRNVSPAQRQSWREVLGQHWPTVAWAGTAAAVLLVVFGAVRFIGSDANNVFSQVGSQMENSGSDRERLAASLRPPQAAPVNGRNFEQFAQLSPGVAQPKQSAPGQDQTANGPMIIRTADLSLITKEFDKARANLEAILKRHRGYVGELKVGGTTGSGRSLAATLRVPADQLDATLTEIKTLGRVES